MHHVVLEFPRTFYLYCDMNIASSKAKLRPSWTSFGVISKIFAAEIKLFFGESILYFLLLSRTKSRRKEKKNPSRKNMRTPHSSSSRWHQELTKYLILCLLFQNFQPSSKDQNCLVTYEKLLYLGGFVPQKKNMDLRSEERVLI